MGSSNSSALSLPWPVNILMLGLDAAGKTTLLYCLNQGQPTTNFVTLGMYVETLSFNNITFSAADVGGCDPRVWQMLGPYKQSADGVVFILDSNDRDRFEWTKSEFDTLLRDPDLATLPLLILANKQDLPGAMSVAEVSAGLELHAVRGRNWHIEGVTAIQSQSLKQPLSWIVRVLSRKANIKNSSKP